MSSIRLLSINAAKATPLRIGRRLHSTGIFKEPTTTGEITSEGLLGDFIGDLKHHGGLDQALYIYSREDYEAWSEKFGREFQVGEFGENLTFNSLGPDLRIGDRYRIGDVLLEVTAPRIPCSTLASRMKDRDFVNKFLAMERPGAYVRVIHAGSIAVGDEVEHLPSTSSNIRLLDVNRIWTAKTKDPEVLRQGLASPLAERARKAFETWLLAATQ